MSIFIGRYEFFEPFRDGIPFSDGECIYAVLEGCEAEWEIVEYGFYPSAKAICARYPSDVKGLTVAIMYVEDDVDASVVLRELESRCRTPNHLRSSAATVADAN